ncbi:MAG TPA: hypothetical protein VF787_03340 [Thermoanaerobaculia bacterium]
MELPSWLQFVLTLAGGWLTGVGTMVIAFWKRISRFEALIAGRVQKIEQTVYGPREDPSSGLVAKQAASTNGISRVEKILIRIAEKLEIEVDLE